MSRSMLEMLAGYPTPVAKPLRRFVAMGLLMVLGGCQFADAYRRGFVSFDREVIDQMAASPRDVILVDMDGDGLQDIVVLSPQSGTLHWYRNPDWRRFGINSAVTQPLAIAARDISGNGLTDLMLSKQSENGSVALGWLQNPRQFPGEVVPETWQLLTIAGVQGSEQLLWADVSGRRREVLINLSREAGQQALTAWTVPADDGQRWGSVSLGTAPVDARKMLAYDWNGDGREQLLLAGDSGVEVLSLATRGRFVDQQNLVAAGSVSHLAVGHGGRADRRFLATIESAAGDGLVIYRPNPDGSEPWSREILDHELGEAGALVAADLNNDGFDEIIVGASQRPHGLYIYRYDREARGWHRSTLGSSMAVTGLAVADLTGNGFKDIVAVGEATANVVIFRNGGR